MGLFRKRERVPNGKAHARREREESQRRLDRDREHVIIPLREMRERNHVSEVIGALIQRRVQREQEE